MTADTGIGAAVKRKEDGRFLTGRGRYTDDINQPGQVHAYFLRSPHAHATINAIDVNAAKSAPGVCAIYTGTDVTAEDVGTLICGWNVVGKNGEGHLAPPHPVIASGKARYVGDPVAVVVADTLAQARDAAELIDVEYGVLPASADLATTLDAGAAQVHDEVPGNMSYDWDLGDKAAVDAAFAGAAHVTKLEIVNNRLAPNAIEPRAAVGAYDPGTDQHTLYLASQNPHVTRLVLSAFHGLAPEHKLRVVAPDVGGGFGSKIFIYNEDVFLTWASAKVGRPIKWTAERSESFITDAHGRDHVTTAELALDGDGNFLAMRVDTIANMGAYLSTFSTAVPTYLYGTLLAGQYKTPVIHVNVRAAFTNTVPVDAYRGAGRPEATFVVERLVEQAARETGVDPAEFRRRNFIQPNEFPYQTPVALQYDSGNYEATMDKALGLADYAGFAARKAEAQGRGKIRGIGFSNYIEACGLAPSQVVGSLGAGVGQWESAQVRFNPTGNVLVFTGSHSHGQGHETTFAQIVSDKLGIALENVEVVHGDTASVPFGMGTYGSRSLAVGGSAIVKACDKIVEKGRKIAAHIMEASVEDIEYDGGNFTIAGTDKAMAMAEIAFAAYVPHNYPLDEVEPGLDENAFYDPANFTYPAGCQICEVEIDPDTGVVEIAKFTAVDDFGNVINPMIVEGQVHGGITQGVGQALYEGVVYDGNGQLVTGSFMDYQMPRADDVPSYDVDTTVTPCPHNPLGVKGCGEAGAIAAPAAVMNAVTDALGIDNMQMPATAEKVWRAANAG